MAQIRHDRDVEPPTLFVPGRLCLFGEHSDWAAALPGDAGIGSGACILTGTDQGITAHVSAARDFEVTSALPDGSRRGPFRVPMESQALRAAAAAGGFFSYAAGVAAVMREIYGCGGIASRARRCDLPLGRGLSSSAAVCVLTARALNRVHGLGLGIREEMELAYRGELAAGSRCGRMDQACAYGRQLVRLRFAGEAMDVDLLRAAQPLYLLVVDLQRSKDTRRILADLHRAFAEGGPIRAALGADNLDLVGRASAALEAGDAPTVGALMSEAQELFDRVLAPASPGLAAPRLHEVLAHAAGRELAWGGKGVGSQGDGAAQFICRGPGEREALASRLEADGMGSCLSVTIEPM